MTAPEPERGSGYEYKPDYPDYQEEGENPPPGGDPDDLDPNGDVREEGERGGYYDSDKDESGGTIKRLQLGCGALIIIGLVLAIVVPVVGSFGGGDGGGHVGGPGADACGEFQGLVEDSQGGGVPIDADFVSRVARISELGADAESPIRDSSAALHIAASVVMAGSLSEPEVAEIYAQTDNLIQACGNAGYFSQ